MKFFLVKSFSGVQGAAFQKSPLAAGGMLLILFLLACGGTEPRDNHDDNHYLALVGVTVIDGKGNPPLTDRVILIKDSIIHDISSSPGYSYPPGTQKLKLHGKYVIPGLIDMHAHVTVMPMTDDGRLSHSIDKEASVASLKTLLAYGITTIRNPAAPTIEGVRLRESVKSGQVTGPDVYTSGSALNSSNAGFGPFVSVKTPVDVKKEIKKQSQAGVDFIKVYAGLKPHLIKTAVEEAHKYNLKVAGHLQNTSWTEAAKLGIDWICHAGPWHKDYLPASLRTGYRPTFLGRLFWLEHTDFQGAPIQEMVKVMRRNNISLDPTLLVFHTKFWGDDPMYTRSPHLDLAHPTILNVWNRSTFVDDWKPSDFQKAKTLWPKLMSLTKLLYDNGIMITAGSDFPNPWVLPGLSMHQEMELFHQAGIPPLEVIKIATYNGAVTLGIDNVTGSIEKGKRADILILDKNPLTNIKNTRHVYLVFKGSKKYIPRKLLSTR